MPKRSKQKLYKLDPKLCMVINGKEVVNVLRAERAASIAVTSQALLNRVPLMRGPDARPIRRSQLPRGVKRGKMGRVPDSICASVFIELAGAETALPKSIRGRGRFQQVVRRESLVAAEVPLSKLRDLLEDDSVVAVEITERVVYDPPIQITQASEEPRDDVRRVGDGATSGAENGVLIGIIDVQGFDYAHPDFLDSNGHTRFVSIWDQGGNTRAAPKAFGYGSELTQKHMNAAIQKALEIGLPPTMLEPQSQMVPSSHGTHVASIAAGNKGVCPQALIAGVLLALPQEDTDRRKSFYDSARIAHAIDYLFKLGEQYKLPVSINISLGTNGHAHDASSITSRWLDYGLSTPGRSVCVAAGNAGQAVPVEPGDWGYVMGRIHASGILSKDQSSFNLYWVVVGDGIADLSENELEIWYSPGDHFAIQIEAPNGESVGPLEPGQFVENQELQDGTFISVYNEIYAPANGFNHISCYLSPFLSEQGVVGVLAGTWVVRLLARDIRDGEFHAWIERDDPRRIGKVGIQEAWSFPSFFSEQSVVDNSTVSSLACGNNIISVANFDEAKGVVHYTSSQGPTRDKRQKPEIAAPGTNIVAANGFDPQSPWVAMTGTSMASPYVAGVIGRLLSAEPSLTAAQIAGILRRTAQPLPGRNFEWQDDAGFGVINPAACLEEAERFKKREDRTP